MLGYTIPSIRPYLAYQKVRIMVRLKRPPPESLKGSWMLLSAVASHVSWVLVKNPLERCLPFDRLALQFPDRADVLELVVYRIVIENATP